MSSNEIRVMSVGNHHQVGRLGLMVRCELDETNSGYHLPIKGLD